MAMAEERPPFSLPKSSSRDRKVTCETLSHVDWNRTRPFESQMSYSDGDEDFSWAASPQLSVHPVASKSSRNGANLFACFPQKSGSVVLSRFMMSPAGEVKRAVVDLGGRIRTHPSPIHHSGSIPHSGPLKLHTGPILSHSGTLIKGSPKGVPSIIPSDIVGKKTRSGSDDDEPTSPEVTCLGRVRIKQKYCKDLAKSTDKRQFREWKNKFMKKKEDSTDRGKLSSPGEAPDPQALSGHIDFNLNLGRFNSGRGGMQLSSIISSEVADRSEAGRGAILAKSLAHLLAEDKPQREEEMDTDYLPEVPPPNALLLIRGSGREWPAKDTIRRQVSLPKPPPGASIWKRRAVAQPSALDIRKPIKLELQQPITR